MVVAIPGNQSMVLKCCSGGWKLLIVEGRLGGIPVQNTVLVTEMGSDLMPVQGCCLTGARSPEAPKLRVRATKVVFKEPEWAPKDRVFIPN